MTFFEQLFPQNTFLILNLKASNLKLICQKNDASCPLLAHSCESTAIGERSLASLAENETTTVLFIQRCIIYCISLTGA